MKEKGELKFKHCKTGKIFTFHWEVNSLNGAWMYWTSLSHAMYASTKRRVKIIISEIKKRNVLIEENIKIK